MVLQVGDISTKVEVAAAAVAVETSNATLKSVVDGKRILELPLNGRNVASLTSLTAGVVSPELERRIERLRRIHRVFRQRLAPEHA